MYEEIIIDTNILIYAVNGNQKILEVLSKMNPRKYYISSITKYEFLVGVDGLEPEKYEHHLNDCHTLEFNGEMAVEAAKIYREYGKMKFKDACIAATAHCKKLPLLTADKAFKKINNLEVIFLSL